MKPFVYVAGPIASHPQHETNRALMLCREFIKTGVILPFSPHTSVLWDIVTPMHYEQWMEYDLDVIRHMDALYRIDGESPGSDREVAFAQELGIPVFTQPDDLVKWARKWCERNVGE